MKIKMLTTKCGPIVSENWSEGQVFNVSVEEARAYVEAHLATALEPFEVATISAPQNAVVAPVEAAVQVKGQVAALKAPVAPPAAPEVQINLQAPAAWGKGGVK